MQDISPDANPVELQANYGADMPRLQLACFHSDFFRIFIFAALLARPLRKGTGANCEKCPVDSFSDEYSSKECTPCPPGSKAVAGATSVHGCACDVGVLYNTTGGWKLFRTAFSSQFLTVFMKPLIWKAC